jgi:hypothetical protein
MLIAAVMPLATVQVVRAQEESRPMLGTPVEPDAPPPSEVIPVSAAQPPEARPALLPDNVPPTVAPAAEPLSTPRIVNQPAVAPTVPPTVTATPATIAGAATVPNPTVQQGQGCGKQMSLYQRWGRWWQDRCIGYPEFFIPTPLGQSVHRNMQTQVTNGEAVRMVLYCYDFIDGTDTLNLRGKDELFRIASMLPRNFFPIVIERTPDAPRLAEARRLAVLTELGRSPFPVPAERVVVGPRPPEGLAGIEGDRMYRNLLSQTQRQGYLGQGGAGGSSGAGGSGSSGFGSSNFGSSGMGGMGGGMGGMGGGMGGMGGGGMSTPSQP